MIVARVPREDVRNRLLRRVDWRFLLPNPWPTRSVCFTGGLLARAVELVSDSIAADPVGDCDLAVAINPDEATLRAARDALRLGGACYTEWYSPRAGGTKGVRHQLEAAGFDDVACYWPWPWPTRGPTSFWLPLDAPNALRWFLTSRPRARSPIRRLSHAVRQAVWLLSLWIGLTLPICAVARKPARDGSHRWAEADMPQEALRQPPVTGMDSDVLEVIRAGWSSWGFGPPPVHLSRLLLTGGKRSINKIIALVFAASDTQPRLVVKMPRVPESIPHLHREAASLQAFPLLRPGGMQGVPRLLFCHEAVHLVALGETVVTGQPLSLLLTRADFRELALKATDWLADLAGHVAAQPRSCWWHRLVTPLLRDFETSFAEVVDPSSVRETKAILATLGDLPIVCEQRDFSPWNVLVTPDGELAVLDWESAEIQGLPALDLIYFLTYLSFFVDGAMISGRFRDSYRATLDPTSPTGSVVSECCVRYAGRTGLNLAALYPLRLLVWLLHSRSEYTQLASDAAGRPDRDALRRSLFVSLWQEELRHGGSISGGTSSPPISRPCTTGSR